MKNAVLILVCLLMLACVGCADPGKRTFFSDVGDAASEEFEYFYFDSGDIVDLFCMDKRTFQYFWGIEGGEEE